MTAIRYPSSLRHDTIVHEVKAIFNPLTTENSQSFFVLNGIDIY
jgi:hypothetical protein